MEKTNRSYEIGYLLKSDFPEEKIKEEVQKIKSAVKENNGLVLEEGELKNHQLAYPVEKSEKAFFGWFQFSLSPRELEKLEKILKNNSALFRYLIMNLKPQAEAKTSRLPLTKSKPAQPIRQQRTAAPPARHSPEAKPMAGGKRSIKNEEIDKQLEEILGT